MNATVFAYGTLQIPEIMARVAGRAFSAEPATLHGFARYRIRGKSFPGVRPEAGASVEGCLYAAVTSEALRRLDDFEDDFYIRQEWDVVTCGGNVVRAQVYVVDRPHYGILEAAAWDLEQFRRQSLAEFLKRCKSFVKTQPADPPLPEL